MPGFYFSISLLIAHFLVTGFLRFNKEARSLKKTESDNGTTTKLNLTLLITLICVIASYFLNKMDFLMINSQLSFFVGLVLAVFGFLFRIIATFTLREYYTTHLKIQENQKVITHGVYRYIRNPGYLGSMSLLIGCGLLTGNLISILINITIVPYSFVTRLLTEEQMLIQSFGDDYKTYMGKSYRLIPFIY